MQTKTITILFSLSFTLFSCRKHCRETPTCINRDIDSFDKAQSCSTACVNKYTYQGKNVYVFDPGTCGADMCSEVKDENCNSMGQLGGLSGNTKINGGDFSTATFKKEIWHQ